MRTTNELDETLKAAGYRVTRPRRRVWTALQETNGHITVEELAERVGDDVDLASVYRTLRLFETLGIARTSRFDERDPGRWEPSHPDEHFHLVCRECGEVDHHVGDLVARIRAHLDEGHGFLVEDVTLTVHGLCASCRGGTTEPNAD
ncbi:MAG: Fur family transcriptional regulator [Nitriliruptoraceae bacterium]